MDPINYGVQGQSPIQAFQGALESGAGIRSTMLVGDMNQLKIDQAKAAADRQRMIDEAFARLRQPGATAKDYMGLAMMLPKEQSEVIVNSFKALKEEERTAALTDTSQVFSALKTGRVDVATDLLRRQAEAERASRNERGAQFAESLIQMLETGDQGVETVTGLMGYTLAALPGGDKAIEAVNKVEAEKRAAMEHPLLMEQKAAELSKAKSEAEKQEIEARYAEELKVAEVAAEAADLKLTKAQTAEAEARTKKLGAEIAKLLMELEALKKSGGIPPEKKFEQEEKIRNEYVKRTQSFTDMRQTYDRMASSAKDPTGAGDIALVTGFMKMLDPGSVVRESEFATARDTGGLSAQLYALSQKYDPKTKGQFLKPEQKEAFLRLAGEYMKASEEHESRVKKDLGNVVRSYGLSEDNVFGTENIKALRDYIKKSNPRANPAEVDRMDEAQIQSRFPNGYGAFKKSTGSAVTRESVVEVNF